ncbi:MAG: hypothetical protein KatS3mg031_2366 [Chitinophagales bacterium]|nr:MAG: hypothetical protein KatS3mg031_2366 [Chitinophagales bacterium]
MNGMPAQMLAPKTASVSSDNAYVSQEWYDVCIIGAGVAGGVLAAFLADHGKRVAVIERNLAEPDRIIGELLQPGGLQQLSAMGLNHLTEGFDAQPIEGYALFMEGNSFSIKYPEGKTGRGFRNGKFIKKIRDYLSSHPHVTLIEGRADDLVESNGIICGVKYLSSSDRQHRQVHAFLTVASDGMFSSFREKLAYGDKKVTGYFLGLILKGCLLPHPNHGHVIITDTSPCLVYPISSQDIRILIDFPGEQPPPKGVELICFLKEKIAPQLPQSIQPSFLEAIAESKFRFMPNHLIPARPWFKQGAVLLGDSLNMRHPLTGGGMTVALTDVYVLGSLLLEKKNTFNSRALALVIRRFYQQRSSHNATINILADALYKVMRSRELKIACYNYLKRGSTYASEPVAILSAISRDVRLLLKHFFAVAFFGAFDLLKPYPTLSGVKRAVLMVHDAVRIIFPLIRNERFKIF